MSHRPAARRCAAYALAALVAGSLAAVAPAQDPPPITLEVRADVTPNKAGTRAQPRGVELDVRVNIGYPANYEPRIVQSVDVWFPRGGLYNGAKYPRCSQRTLSRLGPAACPKGSIMGHGTGLARADTVRTRPRITVVNGGPTKVFFYTVLNNPARVQAPVTGTITRPGGARWSYKLHAVIPRVLQVVAGVPLVLDELHITAGRGDWLATISCPADRRWPYHAEVRFDDGSMLPHDDSVPCR